MNWPGWYGAGARVVPGAASQNVTVLRAVTARPTTWANMNLPGAAVGCGCAAVGATYVEAIYLTPLNW
jgi:hypothetical protein